MASTGNNARNGQFHTYGGAPTFADDLTQIANTAASLIGESVANVAALPSSGNWPGRTVTAADTGVVYVNPAGNTVWVAVNPLTHLKLDATNSVVQTITQIGGGRILGTGAAFVTVAVTFPVAFASVPRISVTSQGQNSAATFSDAALPIGALYGVASNKSTTGFTAGIMAPTGGVPASTYWYFDWIAIGVPA